MTPAIFRKIIIVLAAAAGSLAATCGAWASSPGTSGGLLLAEATTARGSALGGADVALTDDAGAVFYNPAALSSLKQTKTLFTHQMGLAEDSSENLNVASPLSPWGVLGAALIYHHFAPLNDAGADVPSVAANDKLFILSFARTANEWLEGLACGVNLKALNSTIGDFSGNAFAADLGVFWQPLPDGALGLSVKNLGTPLKLAEAGDPLPVRISLGGKYNLFPETDKAEKCFLVAEVEQTMEKDTFYRAGGEYLYANMFAVRLGYAYIPGGTDGLTIGLGIQAPLGQTTLQFDYAYRLLTWVDSLDGAQLFTLGLAF